MPPAKGPAKKTRSRKRKARTEVSSSSSSAESSDSSESAESEVDDPQPTPAQQTSKKQKPSKTEEPKRRETPATVAAADAGDSANLPVSKKQKRKTKSTTNAEQVLYNDTNATQFTPPKPQQTADDKERAEFENWYVRTVTQQFADDLSALRSAPDFRDASVPVLVRALRQGAEALRGE